MLSSDTMSKCPICQLTLYCCVTPKDDQVTTLYTLWTTPSVTVARNSSEHAHITSLYTNTVNNHPKTVKQLVKIVQGF